jgi:hypothetical protein
MITDTKAAFSAADPLLARIPGAERSRAIAAGLRERSAFPAAEPPGKTV